MATHVFHNNVIDVEMKENAIKKIQDWLRELEFPLVYVDRIIESVGMT